MPIQEDENDQFQESGNMVSSFGCCYTTLWKQHVFFAKSNGARHFFLKRWISFVNPGGQLLSLWHLRMFPCFHNNT